MKLNIEANEISHEDLTEFLNSNKIVELKLSGLSKNLSFENLHKTLRVLTIDND